jgi:hypothetical protein
MRPRRKKAPGMRLTAVERAAIQAFLERYLRASLAGLIACKAAAKVPGASFAQGNVKYWDHCVRCIRWLLGHCKSARIVEPGKRQEVPIDLG